MNRPVDLLHLINREDKKDMKIELNKWELMALTTAIGNLKIHEISSHEVQWYHKLHEKLREAWENFPESEAK